MAISRAPVREEYQLVFAHAMIYAGRYIRFAKYCCLLSDQLAQHGSMFVSHHTFSMYFALGSESWAFAGGCCCWCRRIPAAGEACGVERSSPAPPILTFRSAINFLPIPRKLFSPRRPVISSTSFSPDGVKG